MNAPIGIGLLTAGGILIFAGWKNQNILDLVGGFDPNHPRNLGAGGQWNLAGSDGSGGGSSDGTVAPDVTGTVSPGKAFSSSTLGRVDMGVDFTSKGAIPALGDAIITRVSPQNSGTGWPGSGDGGRGNRGAVVAYKLTSGPGKGKFVYLAENIDPVNGLRVGQKVSAGQTIAVARGVFPYLETGWASDAHGTPLGAPGYVEGKQTSAGLSFRRFLGLG